VIDLDSHQDYPKHSRLRTGKWSVGLREKTNTLHADCIDYLNRTFAAEDLHLSKIRAHAAEANREGMQVSPYEGQLLQSLVKWTQAENVLELGTLFGYSTLWMARGLRQDGRIFTVERDQPRHDWAARALGQSEVSDRIHLLCGDIESLKSQVESFAPFDFVFIDANKSGYLTQLLWVEPLVKKCRQRQHCQEQREGLFAEEK